MENNATETTTATTIFLREDQQPISLTARQEADKSVEKDSTESSVERETKKEKTYIKIMKPNWEFENERDVEKLLLLDRTIF